MKAVSSRSISEITRTQTEGADIPEGWVKAPVWGIMNLVNGFPFKPSHWKTTGHPIIRIQNLNNPEAPFNYCPDEIPDKYRVNAGDLLFAWSGTPGTSFGAHIWQGGPAWLNQHIFRVEFNEEFLNKKLVRLAINQNLNDYIDQAHGGAGLAHIKKGEFESSFLLIPPIAEQDRIVAKVDELLAGVNSARERLARVPGILKQFRQSVLAAACSGRLTADWREKQTSLEPATQLLERIRAERTQEYERACQQAKRQDRRPPRKPPNLDFNAPKTDDLPELPELAEAWGLIKVLEAAEFIQYGTSDKASGDYDSGIPVLRMGNIQDGKIDLSDLKFMNPQESEISSFVLEPGDLLFNRTNSPELVGKTAVFESGITAVFASYLVRLRADKNLMLSKLISLWINSPWGKEWARTVKTDGVSQSNINASKLGEMPLPLPPLAEQQEIVRRVEAMFQLADAIEAKVAAGAHRADQLTQAILAKAFRGELVPTEAELARRAGRDFEPAAVLLSRLQEERRLITETQPRRQTLKGRKRQTAGT
jgi:type I restriction enzyme, S subunit